MPSARYLQGCQQAGRGLRTPLALQLGLRADNPPPRLEADTLGPPLQMRNRPIMSCRKFCNLRSILFSSSTPSPDLNPGSDRRMDCSLLRNSERVVFLSPLPCQEAGVAWRTCQNAVYVPARPPYER